jgi:hypothetical protein
MKSLKGSRRRIGRVTVFDDGNGKRVQFLKFFLLSRE